MDEASNSDPLALGPNLSSTQYAGWNSNLSFPSLWAAPGQPARTISAAVILLLGLVGNALLLHRLRCGGCCCAGRFARRRKMDFLLAHLAVADLYGCGLALLSQLPPAADAGEAEWPAGDATCRLFRLLQGSGLLAPSHMLVLLALERHHVVRGPQHLPQPQQLAAFVPARGALAALGWLLALLLALPQAFVYRLAPPHGGSRCLSIFAQLPPWHGRAYAVYGLLTSFVAPACLLGGTCGRMLSALSASSAKEEEPSRGAGGSSRQHRAELPGVAAPPPLLLRLLPVAQCALPSPSAPRSLPRARARALHLTLALTTLFALCGFPRLALELGLAFASPASTAEETRTTLGSIMAATNCALNPYVCLIFHSHRPWARRLQSSLCRCPDGQPRRRAPHRHRPPPPQVAAERTGLWFCPCQTKPPTASAVVQQQEAEARAAAACESGL
ncbi:putative G-protein coupled receptor 150 [Paroedura picta]|uniref:putative G-protein coupled receptor 150 n=1 Tax=Paroedura picta TaxID=143630 RepID=UPI001014D6BF